MQRDTPPTEYAGKNKRIHLTFKNENGALEDLKIYILAVEYPDGRLGEISLKADKLGSTISGLLDALSISISLGLQYGVPIEEFIGRLRNMRFEPFGATDQPAMPRVSSIADAVARWMQLRYGENGGRTG